MRIWSKKKSDKLKKREDRQLYWWLRLSILIKRQLRSSIRKYLRRSNLNRKLLIIIDWKLKEKRSILLNKNEFMKRKRRKFKDFESFKKELLIDKLRSTLWEQRELLKRANDRQDLRRNRNKKRKSKFFKKWQKLERSNFKKRKDYSLNKRSRKETSFSELYSNRKKNENESNKRRKRRNKSYSNTPIN